jgi:hypothetical protein
VTRRYSSGPLNFAAYSPEDSRANATENAILRAPTNRTEGTVPVQNGGSRASSLADGSLRLTTMIRAGDSIAVLAGCIPSPEGIRDTAAVTLS